MVSCLCVMEGAITDTIQQVSTRVPTSDCEEKVRPCVGLEYMNV